MKTEYQGYTYFIKQKENETNIETSLRSWYIAKKSKNKISYDNCEKKSYIMSSKKILKCQYNNNLINTL